VLRTEASILDVLAVIDSTQTHNQWRNPSRSIAGILVAKSLVGEQLSESLSDALVVFGDTGDLAYKKIFPALQKLAKRGNYT
jgi:hypothetical protein